MEFKQALHDEVHAQLDKLPFHAEARMQDGRPHIRISLPSRAMNHRKSLDEWMFGVCIAAKGQTGGNGQKIWPEYRGLDSPSLKRALSNGIDVEPTDSHWFGASLEKAIEYGGDYPAVLILDNTRIARTVRQISINAPPEVHAAAQEFGVGEPRVEGEWIRYSRIPETSSSRFSGYEASYSWYIPGDAHEALLGVILCVPEDDFPAEPGR